MCGIFGVYNKTIGQVSDLIAGLKLLQHRGKDGFGLIKFNNRTYREYRAEGIVKMSYANMKHDIKAGIGHTRYKTSGSSTIEGRLNELQPLKEKFKGQYIYIAHNGNIPQVKGHDTTYLLQYICSKQTCSIEDVLIDIMNMIPASYSIMILYKGQIYATRDRYGVRPLCIGEDKNRYYISSESCALPENSYKRDIMAGEIVKINTNGIQSVYKHPRIYDGLCLFEIIYFLNPKSWCDGINVKRLRYYLGEKLAGKEGENFNKDYVVIGIPETGIIAGRGYAQVLNLEYKQLIRKNREAGRTFILLTNERRVRACKKKFLYDKDNLKDKNIILVDDSIVRGNVMKSLVDNLKDCGVKEIHVRIPSPPVIDVCDLGIAIHKKDELIMHNRTVEEVGKELGVNSLNYLYINEMGGMIPNDSYTQCFTGEISKEIKDWKAIY
uniref:amidophosphoribosyltransferase n=1 Tax=viral metagenome TaxID=1070528 RepID=A0A6C0IRN2_9ZZZZ